MQSIRVSFVLAAVLSIGAVGCSTSGSDEVISTTTTSEPAPDTPACDLLEPADLTAAGIEGTVREKGDVSDNFSIGSVPSTACSYLVEQGLSGASVIVVVANGVLGDAFMDAIDFVDDPQEVDGVGDRAVYEAKGNDSRSSAVYAQEGGRLIKISGVDPSVSPKDTLVALARTVLAA